MAKKKTVAAGPAPKLAGKIFVLDENVQQREEIEQLIQEEGGKAIQVVSGSLDYLVVGYRRGNKKSVEQKAVEELNRKGAAIQLLTEEQFYVLLLPNREEAVAWLQEGQKGRERWQRLWNHWYSLPAPLDLSGIDLRRKNLAFCNLQRLILDHADLRNTNLKGCSLPELNEVRLDGACLSHAFFSQASRCSFKKVDATDAHVNPAVFTGCDFTGANLHKLFGAYTQTTDCIFRKANLKEARLEDSKLQHADFTGANLSAAQLAKCDFTGAKLGAVRLVRADLTDALLVNADLSKADLTDAILVNADLTDSVIDGAIFTGANLTGARLGGLDLSRAVGLVAPASQGGHVGPNIRELEKIAGQSRRLETAAVIDHKGDRIEMRVTCHGNSGWVFTALMAPIGGFYGGARTLSAAMVDLARKWTQGTLRLESITVRVSKGPQTSRELRPLAVAAWCEACGAAIPSDETVQKQLEAHVKSQEQLRREMLDDLRGGKKGVARWNARTREERNQAGHFRRADLSGLDLSGANLSGEYGGRAGRADWQGASFDGAKLVKANLDGCDLRKATFRNADLTEVRCGISRLSGADFTGAKMRKAHLRVCTFSSAIFHKTDLRQADFGYSDLRGVDLSSADLRGAIFEHAKYNEGTRFPPGFTPPQDMAWKGTKPAQGKALAAPPQAGTPTSFGDFLEMLQAQVDPARLDKALAMLKAERFQLYTQLDAIALVGVVKSQTDADTVYSCRLAADGAFGCCTQGLHTCGGLKGRVCKHLLVLVVGLAKSNQLDLATALAWVSASNGHRQKIDQDVMTDTFLRYKGAEAGEVDWRPTETVPEDYYTL